MTDVLVIGCGGGGAVVAKELGEQGLDVLVLEVGPYFENRRGPTAPTRDAADLDGALLDSEWSALWWDMSNPVDGKFRWGPADRTKPTFTRTFEGRTLSVAQVAAVGGTTVHYSGVCPRAPQQSWPRALMPYHELRRYYRHVEAILPVTTWEPQACKDDLIVHHARELGAKAHYAPLAIQRGSFESLPANPTDEDFFAPSYTGCVACGHCNLGCHHPQHAPVEGKAKRGTNVSYMPAALRTGRVEVRPGCMVRRIHAAGGEARGVTYVDPAGREATEEARVVVLSAGAIESPRLWLNSGLPNGLTGEDGPVGRYFTTHFFDFVGGLFPFEVDRFKGPVEASEVLVPGAGKFGALGADPAITAVTSFGLRFGRRVWGLPLKRYMAEYRRSLSVTAIVDDESHPDNRVTLDRSRPPDEAGAIPKVRYVPTAETIRRRERVVALAMDVFRAAGAREDSLFRADAWGGVGHPMGTMRMGTDPSTSVVSPDGQAHSVRRLYLADNSILPNAVGGVNPTLTTQALATRVAERIAAREFGIPAWVD